MDLATLVREEPLVVGLFASLLGGTLATTLGAVPALFLRRLSEPVHNVLISFAAGIMLAATVFALLLPGLEEAEGQLGGAIPAVLLCILGLLLGALALWSLHGVTPHEHFAKGREGPERLQWSRVWLFVIAITLHNFPEGLSIGVGAGSRSLDVLVSITVGMGLQNIPEGLVIAMALRGEGYSKRVAFGAAFVSGLVEAVGGVIGVLLTVAAAIMLPVALAFAAGAMLFVISNEVIPETHRGSGTRATVGLMIGFALMMFLDIAVGEFLGDF
jgi:zinc transporter, ZIP family